MIGMVNTSIEQINNEYYVLVDYLDKRICKKFPSQEEALKFQEEIYLNICLFLMYGTDDKKNLEAYSRKTYVGPITEQYDYESYKDANLTQLFSRNMEVKSSSSINYNGSTYQEINSINDITLKRNKIKYHYLKLDKIQKILKKILLLKGKKQGGFNLTNLYWDASISSKLVEYLFPELQSSYDEKQEQSIRNYTGQYYAFFNDFLCGNVININSLTSDMIDSLIEIVKCFRPTPYDLYLYRGAGEDSRYYQNGNEFSYHQFVSTSISAPSARPFANEEYQIKIPEGTRVLFIGASLDKESTENEVLLMPSKHKLLEEKGQKRILQFEENIDPIRLMLDNLVNNKEAYINQVGEHRYQVIYDYLMKKSLEIKKDELLSVSKSNPQKTINILTELQLLIGYYGVQNQKEDHDLEKYTM